MKQNKQKRLSRKLQKEKELIMKSKQRTMIFLRIAVTTNSIMMIVKMKLTLQKQQMLKMNKF